MTVGSPQLIYTNFDNNTGIDISPASLKDPNDSTKLASWTSNGQFSFAKYRGTLDLPQQTQGCVRIMPDAGI